MGGGAIYSRRSIREFRDADVVREDIEEIIRAGSAAPSAKNRQPWKCIVLKDRGKEEFLGFMEKGIEREENSFAMLPKSKSGLPDAKTERPDRRPRKALDEIVEMRSKADIELSERVRRV